MSLYFYPINEDIPKKESINNYENIFNEFSNHKLSLEESLNDLLIFNGLPEDKAKEISEKICKKSKEIVNKNWHLINKKYPLMVKEEAMIISSYLYEEDELGYNPYEIINKNLCEENREEGIKNISKYFYLFLKTLRILDKIRPKQKYLYRCIDKKVKLKQDLFNKKIEPYYSNRTKIFWGFTSITTTEKFSYNINNKRKDIKTIFAIFGDIWGYDISFFNLVESRKGKKIIIIQPTLI